MILMKKSLRLFCLKDYTLQSSQKLFHRYAESQINRVRWIWRMFIARDNRQSKSGLICWSIYDSIRELRKQSSILHESEQLRITELDALWIEASAVTWLLTRKHSPKKLH
jgi:hypothetical protein